jgi:hypothetical protein
MGEPFTCYRGSWTVTVWMASYGQWHYHISRGSDPLRSGTVDAINRTWAVQEALLAEGIS